MKLFPRTTTIITILGTLSLFNASQALAEALDTNNIMQPKIEAFVNPEVLNSIKVGSDSTVELSNLRAIAGETSLLWNYQSGSSIILKKNYYVPTDDEAYQVWGRRSTPLLSFFVYNEEPVDDYLLVDLGNDLKSNSTGDAGFKVKLNFKGWRAIGVSLNNDVEAKIGIESAGSVSTDGNRDSLGDGSTLSANWLSNQFDSIRLTAPKSHNGRLFIDHVMLSIDDARYQWSDYHVKTRITEPEVKFNYAKLPNEDMQTLVDNVQTIQDRFTKLLLDAPDPRFKENIDWDKLQQAVTQLGVSKSADGIIKGPHVQTIKQRDRYQFKYLTPEDKARFDQFVDLGDYSVVLYNLSRAYHKYSDIDKKKWIADQYLLLTQHLIDQGYYKGSGLITTHHWGYSSRWWYLSAFLMQDVLQQAQIKQTVFDALLWYSREFKASFDMTINQDSSDLDYFNTLVRQHLALLFLETNPQKRVKLINSYAKYLNRAIAQTPPGTKDGLRPDGTAWRHDGNYPGYSFPALPNMAILTYLFKGTPFAFESSTYELLKKVLVSAWVYSNPNTSFSISGRLPFVTENINNVADAYYWLALASPNQVDSELASIYLQITGKTTTQGKELFNIDVEPATLPQGSWSFNGGAFGIHRYNDKMVTLKTYNSNVWSSEIYVEENRYGRYQSHGTVQILNYGSPEKQGYVENGWDWNRIPGTTTIHLPYDQLNSPITHTLLLRGETPYSGTSSLLGKYGMMAAYIQHPTKYSTIDSKFTAKKSVLAVDDHLILVGTDINSGNNNKDVETTLFQLGEQPNSQAIINGTNVTLNYKTTFKTGDWIIDGAGNGYLITDAQQGVISKELQHSIQGTPDERYVAMERKETQGVFTTAYIQHENTPSQDKYEYVIYLDTTPAKMQKIADDFKAGKFSYNFKSSNDVHIITDHTTNVTGYSFFKPSTIEDKLLVSANYPCIVMIKNQGNQLQISGVTPDLNINGGKVPKPVAVKVVLKGVWNLANNNPNISHSLIGNNTELTFMSYFGIPQEVTLSK